MVYVENNKYVFHKHFVTFIKKQNNKEKTIKTYTDNPGRIERMVNRNYDTMYNFNTESLIPTVIQYERLNEINDLKLENKESRITDVSYYIEYGVVLNNDGPFTKLFEKATETTKSFIIDQLKPLIKKCRNQLEKEGYLFKDHLFDCDEQARNSMAGAAASMSANSLLGKSKEEILKEKIIWKLFDNSYVELTSSEIITLGDQIKNYYADSIAAESLTIEKLKTKTIQELLNIKDLEDLRSILRNRDDEHTNSIYDIYKEVLKEYRDSKGV